MVPGGARDAGTRMPAGSQEARGGGGMRQKERAREDAVGASSAPKGSGKTRRVRREGDVLRAVSPAAPATTSRSLRQKPRTPHGHIPRTLAAS